MDISQQLIQPVISKLWLPVLGLIILVLVIRLLFDAIIPSLIERLRNSLQFHKGTSWRSDRDLLQWLRGMKPAEFEQYIATLFSNLGFNAEKVGRSHDGGVDVIIKKDGIISYIQCKKFITSEVPVSAVRDFYGSLADHLANGKGYFITTNRFTLEAEKFAEDKPIELIDSFKLVRYIRMTGKNTLSENYSEAIPSMICPRCGSNLVKRSGKFGKFIGCSTYPKCTYTSKINA